MAGFMGPAALIPLGDPLMGLVDTVCIGQFAGTMELAAMGPANFVFSFSIYIFQCLQVATLSLVASTLREGRKGAAERILAVALTMAIVFGLATTLVLQLLGSQLIGATGIKDVALIPLASDYMGIRSLAQPAVLVTMVAQSGLLAQQDSLTPCVSVMLAVFVSLVANIIFVAGLGWGLRGAAITTVATQYVGAGALLWALTRGTSKLRPQWGVPRASELGELLRTMGPLTVVSMSKNTCYLIVQTTAATLSTLCLAAHQAAFSIWALATWTISPIEQACMAFLPAARNSWERQATASLVLVMGAVVAVAAGSCLLALLSGAPGLLVKDVAVQPHMATIALPAMLSMSLVGVDVSATACNLASKDFGYVARSYVVTLAVCVFYYYLCRTCGWGLEGVWWGVVAFFAIRAVQSLARAVSQLQLLGGTVASSSSSSESTPPGTSVANKVDVGSRQLAAGKASSSVSNSTSSRGPTGSLHTEPVPAPTSHIHNHEASLGASNGNHLGDGSSDGQQQEVPHASSMASAAGSQSSAVAAHRPEA